MQSPAALPQTSDQQISEDAKSSDYGLTGFVDEWLSEKDLALKQPIIAAFKEQDDECALGLIDGVIPLLPKTSPIYILLENKKADILTRLGRVDEGAVIFSKLIKTFPEVIPVRQTAIAALAYTRSVDLAARWWIELSAISEDKAREIDGYTLNAAINNLEAAGENDLRDKLYIALEQINYNPGSITQTDKMYVSHFINAARDRGRDDEARIALNKISDATALIELAANKRYFRFWDNIDVSHQALTAKVLIKLTALGQEFATDAEGLTARQYLRYATSFTDPKTVTDAYLPILDNLISQSNKNISPDEYTPFLVASLADALISVGKQDTAEKLMVKAYAAFGDQSGSIRLNVTSNYAVLLKEAGRPEEALPLIERAIAELTASNSSIDALARMHTIRLESYYMLNRINEAADSRAAVEKVRDSMVGIYSDAMLANGDYSAARDAVTNKLGSSDPDAAISYLQHPLDFNLTPSDKKAEAAKDKLRNDQAVIDALSRIGRILPIKPIFLDGFDQGDIVKAFKASVAPRLLTLLSQ